MNDVFQDILRENEARDSAPRGEIERRGRIERKDVPRERVEHDVERPAVARRRSDAPQEVRHDDRYSDTRDEPPVADDIQATDRSDRRGHLDESHPRAEGPDQGTEPGAATADTQEHDDMPMAVGTPAETVPGKEAVAELATPVIAAESAVAGNPATPAPPLTQVAAGAAAPAPAVIPDEALKPANPKNAMSNAPRPAETPAATAAGPSAAFDGAVAKPVLGEAEAAPVPAEAKAKAIQTTSPVSTAEAGIPIKSEQEKRTQVPGPKAAAPASSSEASELVSARDKENQAPTAARNGAHSTGHATAANATPPVNTPATQAEAIQAARANPVPPSLENSAQRVQVASETAADGLKTAASAGVDPMQVASRAASSRPGSTPIAGRPVPLNEVAVTIQRAVARGEDRIRIRLHPAELGQVDVRLKVGADGIVRALVQVERPETFDLLQRDSRGLERALQDAGLKTDSGSLSFNLREKGEDGLGNRDGDDETSLAGREPADTKTLAADEAAEIPVRTGLSNRVLDIRV